jgi:hypothetical protein
MGGYISEGMTHLGQVTQIVVLPHQFAVTPFFAFDYVTDAQCVQIDLHSRFIHKRRTDVQKIN